MGWYRVALANLRMPATPVESVELAEEAIAKAAAEQARIVCFPEGFVPGYRLTGRPVAPPDAEFLERAWHRIARAAAQTKTAVVLGTERFVDGVLTLTALVIDADGSVAGFQDKVQIDPSEEGTYAPGIGKQRIAVASTALRRC